MGFKYSFFNDYSEGAHPRILQALGKTNLHQEPGYGEDSYCTQAAKLIKHAADQPAAAVHFVSGGTQANLIVLAALLQPYGSVISAGTAHIHIHEAGAVEATGHKINTVDRPNGKITPEDIVKVLEYHSDEHMVKPQVAFISQSTEVGTIYSKAELIAISRICKDKDLYLYLDGARLGSALTAIGSDLTLPDIARLVDVFYIGGTKNGCLLGEAIVITNPSLQPNFRYHLKQRGALLAKGRVLGLQFLELFTDGLFFELATHANLMADTLSQGIKNLGYKFLTASATNQIFPILPNPVIAKLSKNYGFYTWSKVDERSSCIRLVTSWATPPEAVADFLSDLKSL